MKKNNYISSTFAVASLASLFVMNISMCFATPLSAVETPKANTGEFTIYPTYYHGNNSEWIIDKVTANTKLTEYVTVENLTNKPLKLDLNFREATQKNKIFTASEDTDFKNIGNWVKPEVSSLTLNPLEKKSVPLTINVPNKTANGLYLGSIFASSSYLNSQNINIVTRIGTRIYLTVEAGSWLKTDVFDSGAYKNSLFLILSTVGFAATIILNFIYFIENRRYEKAKI